MAHQADLLRVATCGNVDDGKSTLIGRLIHDCGQVPSDQLATLQADSRRLGHATIDYSLLVDGLQMEREQNITIDVAYRYFGTPRRRFIVADTPGHEQYTKNMATGASVSEAAIVVLDATRALAQQTRRHTTLLGLFGIRDVVLAVNKMDLADWDEARFRAQCAAFEAYAASVGVDHVTAVPVSATRGDTIVTRSTNAPWYQGPTLIEALEQLAVTPRIAPAAFHMPVQRVSRPSATFRGYAGSVAGGALSKGDTVVLLPSGRRTSVSRVIAGDRDVERCEHGDAVTLVLSDDSDIARGDVIAAPDVSADVADQFEATLIWLASAPMLPGRAFTLKCATQEVSAAISQLKSRLDIDTLGETAARHLDLNEIGRCNITTMRPLVMQPFKASRTLGSFILIDKLSGATVAAGLINFALRRAANVRRQSFTQSKADRARHLGQTPRCIWLTGLPGSGKSTLANALEKQLTEAGRHTYVLDGDNVRLGLNRDLGFTDADRVENIRRVAEVARLMVDAGLIVIVSLISPFRADRQMARDLFEDGEFVEVYVSTPLDVCEARDPKGLYRKARSGALTNLTGVNAPYETPEKPDYDIPCDNADPADLAARFINQAKL